MEFNMTNTAESSIVPEMFVLAKSRMWWLWKGYITLTDHFGAPSCIHSQFHTVEIFTWEYRMDDYNPQIQGKWVDDPASFPSLKPDSDLYGIPSRSRKQRGWYHVHRLPCILCSPFLPSIVGAPTPSSGSTASRFPAEIVHQIVQGWELERTQAALVCKHWANVCLSEGWQPRLRGRKRIMQLRSLVSAPGSYLKHSILDLGGRVEISLDVEDDPWLHLMSTTRKLLPRCSPKTDHVIIRGPLCKELQTMRSVHVYLPRQVPSLFSSSILRLQLHSIHFRNFRDLAHTLDELPILTHFYGADLTWVDPTPSPAPLHWRARNRFHALLSPGVWLLRCTRNLEAIPLLVGACYNCVCMPSVLESLTQDNTSIQVRSMHTKHSEHLSMVMYHINFESALQLRVMQIWQPSSSSPLCVKLNIRLDRSPSAIVFINWDALDNSIMDYAQVELESVVIGQYAHSPAMSMDDHEWKPMDEDEKQFIRDHLPRSSAAVLIWFTRPELGEWHIKDREELEAEKMAKNTEEKAKVRSRWPVVRAATVLICSWAAKRNVKVPLSSS